MKYLKYFEFETNELKIYWAVRNERNIFKKSLDKIGCPKNIISEFLDQLYDFDDTIFVCKDNLHWFLTESGLSLKRKGYKFQGLIPITLDELKQIEIERDIEKYNL
jgi:hypothetical protein